MSAKYIKLQVNVWYQPDRNCIKIAGKKLTASWVSNDPASVRYHPNLFRKLAKALRDEGMPAPDIDKDEA